MRHKKGAVRGQRDGWDDKIVLQFILSSKSYSRCHFSWLDTWIRTKGFLHCFLLVMASFTDRLSVHPFTFTRFSFLFLHGILSFWRPARSTVVQYQLQVWHFVFLWDCICNQHWPPATVCLNVRTYTSWCKAIKYLRRNLLLVLYERRQCDCYEFRTNMNR